jgi:hypothetical protein
MSDERSRREPTVSDTERPMYESLPNPRSYYYTGEGESTLWTPREILSISLMLVIAAIAGWHYYAHLQIEKAMQANADEHIANLNPKATAKVEINPLSNFVSINIVIPLRGYKKERFEDTMILDAIVENVRAEGEPILDRDLELTARQFFDLYAMALPYRASIEVEVAPDPPRQRR